jgi:hypothetical protein
MQGTRGIERDRRVKPVESGRHPRIRGGEDENFADELARQKTAEEKGEKLPGEQPEAEAQVPRDKVEIASLADRIDVEDEDAGQSHLDVRV